MGAQRGRLLAGLAVRLSAAGIAVVALAADVACGGGSDTPSSPTAIRSEISGMPSATISPVVPQLTPLENLIQNGRLELHGEKDWEKYFTPVTPEEATDLLLQANNTHPNNFDTDFKILFPMDPRYAPSMVLQDLDSDNLGIGNISSGTVLYSPAYGITEITTYMGVTDVFSPRYAALVYTKGQFVHRYYMQIIQGVEPFVPVGPDTSVLLGSPLMKIASRDAFIDNPGRGFQATLSVAREELTPKGRIRDLLTKDGKIAFIPQS